MQSWADNAGRCALVVDDDPEVVVMLTTVLRGLRYTVVGAENAAVALSLIQLPEYAFSLIVTDFQMPGRTGVDLIRDVLKIKASPPRMILLTSMELSFAPIQELKGEVDGRYPVIFASKNTGLRTLLEKFREIAK